MIARYLRDARFALWRVSIWRWRLLASFFGAITRRLVAFHERLHPEYVTAYRCSMCEDREMGVYE